MKKRQLIDIIPSRWFSNKKTSSVFLRVYNVLRVSKEYLISKSKIIDFNNVVVVITWIEGLPYKSIDDPDLVTYSNGEYKFFLKYPDEKTLSNGSYLMLIAPFDIDGKKGNESAIKQSINSVTSLFGLFIGRNAVYKHIFDSILYLDGKTTSTISPVIENPDFFSKPDFKQENIDFIKQSYEKISKLDEKERYKINLSLQWYYSALYDTTDAFSKYWLAIESLMPTSQYSTLIEILKDLYHMSYNETRDFFMIKKLWKLRSKHVHGNRLISSHGYLLNYLEALYFDLFIEKIGLLPQYRARSVLNDSQFDLTTLINSFL